MKKLYIFLGLIVLYSLLAVAMSHKISKEKLEGKWNVKVTDAPYGYQDYVIEIKEDRGEYKADILFVESNYKIPDLKITLENGKLTGNLTVEGEDIDITIWEEKKIVKGLAKSTSVGTLPMVFTRSKD